MFKDNKKQLDNDIINDTDEVQVHPDEASIRGVYQRNLWVWEPYIAPTPEPCGELYEPITIEEVRKQLRKMPNKTAGPDYFKVADLKATDPKVLSALYNLCPSSGKLLTIWKKNRTTTLIPKKTHGLEHSSNWRPITISSVIARLFHRIIAKRLVSKLNLNERQKAFLPTDSCSSNARKNKKTLFIIGIDRNKAFDSVSHYSNRRARIRHALHPRMIEYIMDSYTGAVTNIPCGPTKIHGINLYREVKQGDPLSSILFNLVLDELLSSVTLDRGNC